MNTILRFQKLSFCSRNLLCKIQKTSFCCHKSLHFLSVPVLKGIPSPSLCASRNFWETFPGTRPLLHLKDNLDGENHEIIFRSKLFNFAFYGQLVALSTFAVQSFYGLYFGYQSVYYQIGPTLTHFNGMPVVYDSISLMILMSFTLHNVMVYYLAQKLLLRVYHKIDTDEYVFVSLCANPFKSRLTYCKPGELIPLNKKGWSSFLGNYAIKERKFYLNYERFFDLAHFNRLLSEEMKD